MVEIKKEFSDITDTLKKSVYIFLKFILGLSEKKTNLEDFTRMIDSTSTMMGPDVDQKSSCMMGTGNMMHHGIPQQVRTIYLSI